MPDLRRAQAQGGLVQGLPPAQGDLQGAGLPLPARRLHTLHRGLHHQGELPVTNGVVVPVTSFFCCQDEGLYTVVASNCCGSISHSVVVRILEDEQEYEWMTYR